MQFITGRPETREQTKAGIARVQRCWSALGTGWWAFIDLPSGRIVGAGCIQYARRDAVMPSDLESLRCNPLEIGWRLHPEFWHLGLASEAAARMTAFAFDTLAAPELIAVRHPDNTASTGWACNTVGGRRGTANRWPPMRYAERIGRTRGPSLGQTVPAALTIGPRVAPSVPWC